MSRFALVHARSGGVLVSIALVVAVVGVPASALARGTTVSTSTTFATRRGVSLTIGASHFATARTANDKLDSALGAIAETDRIHGSRAALEQARQGGLVAKSGRVQVELRIDPSAGSDVRRALGRLGGATTGSGDHGRRMQAFVPPASLHALAKVGGIQAIRRPTMLTPTTTVTSEGDAVLNAPAWRTAGFDGTGVKVGIIDLGFLGYTSLLGT